MNVIKELNDFIDRALKDRKYPLNTAINLKSPFKWIEPELTEEEKNSFDILKKNLDQIFNTAYAKSSKLSASSIEVYKRRTKNLIEDYERYGKDPSAMANWNRPILTRKQKDRSINKTSPKTINDISQNIVNSEDNSLTRHEEMLHNGKAFILTPHPLVKQDISVLRAYIDYLEKKIPINNNNTKEDDDEG